MNYKDIEIEGMKELLKENEIEIARLRKENKNLKKELDESEKAFKYIDGVHTEAMKCIERLNSDLLMYQNQYGVLTD